MVQYLFLKIARERVCIEVFWNKTQTITTVIAGTSSPMKIDCLDARKRPTYSARSCHVHISDCWWTHQLPAMLGTIKTDGAAM